MSSVEILAALLGIINVVLVIRRSTWNYPFGLVTVALYFFVFFNAKLYSDALLQIFFFGIQLYGWRAWVVAPHVDDGVAVTAMQVPQRLQWLGATAGASLLWGLGMARFTDAAAPIVDAIVAGTSVAAQLLQSLRRVEAWMLWLLVNMIAVPLYFSRALYPTTALFAVFLILSVVGLTEWKRKLA